MNKDKSRAFRSQYESCEAAIIAVINKLGCSRSKAEKITWGTYKCMPNLLELRAIAELFGCEKEELFIGVDASRKGTTRKAAS